MRKFPRWAVLVCVLVSTAALAGGITQIAGLNSTINQDEQIKSTLQALWAFGQLLSYEDTVASIARVEQQFSYSGSKTADYQVKASAGFVHAITCSTPAGGGAGIAGAVTLRDALTETTPIVTTLGFPLNAYFVPFTIIVDSVFTTGIYLGFDGTVTNVSCSVSFR